MARDACVFYHKKRKEEMRKALEKVGGRKWVLVMLLVLVGTVALWMDKITGAQWVQLAGILMGAYGVSNAITHVGHARANATPIGPVKEEMFDAGH